MNKSIKNVKTLLISILLAFSMLFVVLGTANTIAPARASTQAPTFHMYDGASIRLSDPCGIRFSTLIEENEYQSLMSLDANAKFGTVIIPKHVLGNNTLTVNTDGTPTLSSAQSVEAVNWDTNVEDNLATNIDETGYRMFNAVLVGKKDVHGNYTSLPSEMYDVPLIARSYVIYTNAGGEKVVEYATGTIERTISQVASSLILSGYQGGINYLHHITNVVALAHPEESVNINNATQKDNYVASISANSGNIQAIFLIKDSTCELITDWSYSNGTLTFGNNYIQTLKKGKYTYKLLSSNSVSSLLVTIDDFIPSFRMVVASDTHISINNGLSYGADVNGRFENMFNYMDTYAQSQNYKNFDAVLLAGDLSDSGTEAEFRRVKEILDNSKEQIASFTNAKYVFTMGNHDFWGNKADASGRTTLFESVFYGDYKTQYWDGSKLNEQVSTSHTKINGYHFITLRADADAWQGAYPDNPEPGWRYSDEVVAYARAELEKANKDTPDKPIFVIQHVPLSNTVGGTCTHTGNSATNQTDMAEVFAKYPNIVCFAGHSHFAVNDECAIHQKDFTTIATGSLYYATDLFLDGSRPGMLDQYNFAQNLMVEMDNQHRMRVRVYDIYNNKFVGETWELDGYTSSDFVYTEDRFEDGDLFFDETASIELANQTNYYVDITFDTVPLTSLTARAYEVVLKNASGYEIAKKYVTPDYFNEDRKTLTTFFDCLQPENTYTVHVTALNPLYCNEILGPTTMRSNTLIKEIVTGPKTAKPRDEIAAFNSKDDLQYFTSTLTSDANTTGATLSWKQEAYGVAGGVLYGKFTTDSIFSLNFDIPALNPYYREYDYIVFRTNIRKPADTRYIQYAKFFNAHSTLGYVYHNNWINYIYRINDKTPEQLQNAKFEFTPDLTKGTGEFYIDEIYLMKDVGRADLSVKVVNSHGEQVLKEGDTLSAEVINPSNATYKSFTITDPNGNQVDNPSSFVAKKGKYTATITISTSHLDRFRNNLYYAGSVPTVITKTFIVRSPSDDVIFSFTNDSEMGSISANSGVTLTRSETCEKSNAETEKGILNVAFKNVTSVDLTFNVTTLNPNYKDYSYIVVRVYMKGGNTQASSINLGGITAIVNAYEYHNAWKNYIFKVKDYTTSQLQKLTLHFGVTNDGSTTGYVYIDDIFLMKDAGENAENTGLDINITGKQTEGEQITVDVENPNSIDIKSIIIKDPDKNVVYQNTKPYLTYSNNEVHTGSNTFIAKKGTYTVTIYTIRIVYVGWNEGTRESIRDALYYGGAETIFTKQFVIASNSDIVHPFDSDTENVTATGATLNWVESVQLDTEFGGTGILHGTHTGNVTLNINVPNRAPYYNEYDWLVVRAYFPKTNDATTHIVDTDFCGVTANEIDDWVAHNLWVNYVYNIATLSKEQLQNATLNLISSTNTTGTGEFWIEEIYLMKDFSKSDISIDISGNLVENGNARVTLTNPSGARFMSYQVLSPNGTAITNLTSEKELEVVTDIDTLTSGVYTIKLVLIADHVASRHHYSTRETLYFGGRYTQIVKYISIQDVDQTDKVLAFDNAYDVGFITPSTTQDLTLSWVETPTKEDGSQLYNYSQLENVARGALKVKYTNIKEFKLNFNLTVLNPNYGEYDWLVVRTYMFKIDNDNTNSVTSKMLLSNIAPDTNYTMYHNAWKNYAFNLNNYTLEQLQDLQLHYVVSNSNGSGYFFIDEIYLMKDVSKADLDINVEGVLTEKEKLIITPVNPSNAEIKELTVLCPHGDIVYKKTEPFYNIMSAFEEGSLTIDSAIVGTYTVKITLTREIFFNADWIEPFRESMRNALYYAQGGVTTLTFTFTVAPKEADSILSFTSDSELSALTIEGADTVTHRENYYDLDDSREPTGSGFLHVTHSGTNVSIKFDITKLAPNYRNYDWVILRANFRKLEEIAVIDGKYKQDANGNLIYDRYGNLVPDTKVIRTTNTYSNYFTLFGQYPTFDPNGKTKADREYYLYHNRLKNYAFNISNLTDTQLQNAELRIFGGEVIENMPGEFWIDEIFLMKDISRHDLSLETTGTLAEGENISVSLSNPSGADYQKFTLKDPNGNIVYSWEKDIYYDYRYNEDTDSYIRKPNHTITETGSLDFVAKGGTYTAEVVFLEIEKKFGTAIWNDCFNRNIRYALYFGGRETKIELSFEVVGNDYVSTFSEPSEITNFNSTDASLTWVNTDLIPDSSKSAKGLLYGTYTTDDASINFDLTTLSPNYKDYKYIVIRALYRKPIDNSGNALQTYTLDAQLCGLAPHDFYVWHNSWQNYVYDISGLSENELKNATLRLFNVNGSNTIIEGTTAEFYIDEIFLLKDISEADLDIEVTGNLVTGETLSVEVINPSEADYVSVVVTDSQGVEVQDITSFTAVQGEYTVTITLFNKPNGSTGFRDNIRNIRFYGNTNTITKTFIVE